MVSYFVVGLMVIRCKTFIDNLNDPVFMRKMLLCFTELPFCNKRGGPTNGFFESCKVVPIQKPQFLSVYFMCPVRCTLSIWDVGLPIYINVQKDFTTIGSTTSRNAAKDCRSRQQNLSFITHRFLVNWVSTEPRYSAPFLKELEYGAKPSPLHMPIMHLFSNNGAIYAAPD